MRTLTKRPPPTMAELAELAARCPPGISAIVTDRGAVYFVADALFERLIARLKPVTLQ